MENGPFIDGLPIKNGDFPLQTVSSPEGIHSILEDLIRHQILEDLTITRPSCQVLLSALNLDASQKEALAEYNHNQQMIEPFAQQISPENHRKP